MENAYSLFVRSDNVLIRGVSDVDGKKAGVTAVTTGVSLLVMLTISFLIFSRKSHRGKRDLEVKITERRRAEEEIKIRNKIAEIFLTVSDEEMYSEVLQVILEATDSKHGVFGYIDEKGALIVPTMTKTIWDQCRVSDKDIVYPRETWGDSIWPRAIRQKKTLCSNERSTLTPEGHLPVFRNICVPIIHGKEVIGLFHIANKDTDYDQSDTHLLETIGSDVAPVLNARLQRDREEKKRKQAAVRMEKEFTAITGVVNDMLRGEVDDAVTENRVLDACLAATDSIYGMIGMINEHGKYDTTTYSSQTLKDCAFSEALAWEMSTGMTIRGIWGWPMLHGKPLLCNDLQAHPDRVGLPKGHAPLWCFLGVPLKREGKVVGMVAVANKPTGYTQEDRDALIRLASVISVSRQHRLALRAAKRTHEELEQLVAERTKQLQEAREQLEEKVKERTAELRKTVNLMAGREVRMAELKETIRKLREQVESAGLTPVADDPLKDSSKGHT